MPKTSLISLFSGAGGLDLGLEQAGFVHRAAVELDPTCCASLRASRRWPVIEGDLLADATRRAIVSVSGGRRPDLLAGGPPCQPFSKAGYWARGDSRRMADPRARTLGAFLRVWEELLPQVVLLENVEGLKYAGKSEGFDHLLRAIERINRKTSSRYRATHAVVNAADFGVPQRRVRFFLIADRDGREFEFPKPTHSVAGSATRDLAPHRTAWDALGDLDDPGDSADELQLRGKWAALLPSIPEGANYLWHTRYGGGTPLFGWRRRYWSFLLKLSKRLPSWTISAQPGPAIGPFHWNNRRLSTRELCRLQTFPDDVTIVGSRGERHRQIGNAVPSLMAEILGREIQVQLLGNSRFTGPPRLLPKRLDRVPPPERVFQLPARFRYPVQPPEDHPGTGRGPGARAVRANSALGATLQPIERGRAGARGRN